MALYDAMNDDDEEVRDEAARVVSELLTGLDSPHYNKRHNLSVPAARAQLLDFLTAEFTYSNQLWAEMCLRASGCVEIALFFLQLSIRSLQKWSGLYSLRIHHNSFHTSKYDNQHVPT